jgi:hypothetical protein
VKISEPEKKEKPKKVRTKKNGEEKRGNKGEEKKAANKRKSKSVQPESRNLVETKSQTSINSFFEKGDGEKTKGRRLGGEKDREESKIIINPKRKEIQDYFKEEEKKVLVKEKAENIRKEKGKEKKKEAPNVLIRARENERKKRIDLEESKNENSGLIKSLTIDSTENCREKKVSGIKKRKGIDLDFIRNERIKKFQKEPIQKSTSLIQNTQTTNPHILHPK